MLPLPENQSTGGQDEAEFYAKLHGLRARLPRQKYLLLNTKTDVKEPVSTESLNDLIIDSIQDIKGKNIVKLDLRELDDAPAEYFIICEGDSNTQVKAIGDNIALRVKKEGNTLPSHHEGQQNALWICLDYFTTVVHIFYKETRSFYELEDLWSDATFTEYESL